MSDTRLYLISPPEINIDEFASQLTEALDGGDVACFQLRLKEASDAEISAATEKLMPICHAKDVAFVLNDKPDLAKQLGTDGVHIGQDDMPYAEARSLLGADAIIGVTCHDSRHLAMVAGEQGADYVAFGAFFATDTKETKHTAEVDLVSWWVELMEIPVVAIGGITVDNCDALITAGADFLAISGGVWSYADGPKEAVRLITEKCA